MLSECFRHFQIEAVWSVNANACIEAYIDSWQQFISVSKTHVWDNLRHVPVADFVSHKSCTDPCYQAMPGPETLLPWSINRIKHMPVFQYSYKRRPIPELSPEITPEVVWWSNHRQFSIRNASYSNTTTNLPGQDMPGLFQLVDFVHWYLEWILHKINKPDVLNMGVNEEDESVYT